MQSESALLPYEDGVGPNGSVARRRARRPKHYDRRDAIMDSSLTQSEKDVLAVILRHMGFSDGCSPRSAWCGEERIAIMASICQRTVRSTLKRLTQRGVLNIERRSQRPSLYTIDWTRLKELADPRLAPKART